MIDVDFSLAINNRTGKYYLGLDIIETLGARVGQVLYGRSARPMKNDLARRIHGRLHHWETLLHALRPGMGRLAPRTRRSRPVLHLDPLTAVNHRMRRDDIVLCHDVGPITHPQYFAAATGPMYQTAYAQIARAGCHMVFVSMTTQQEFHRLYGTNFASSSVIYIPTRLGVSANSSRQPEGAPVADRYFLTVGSLGHRKNQCGSIAAFVKSGLAEQGYQYLLIGGEEPCAEDVLELAARSPGVRVMGYVPDDELVWLYRNALAFVLMSRLEGFGMPVVEAATLDIPCLVTRGGILEEVGGPSTISADLDDLSEISSQMKMLAAMPIHERRALAHATAAYAYETFDREKILASWRALIDKVDVAHSI